MSARATEIHRGSRLFETVDFEDLDPARFIHLNMNTKLTKVADGKRALLFHPMETHHGCHLPAFTPSDFISKASAAAIMLEFF
ncbi:hypothetical protein WN943_023474 [Citrus x changshan-huyou]